MDNSSKGNTNRALIKSLTMQAEYALPFWVPFQQPPLFISHRNAPDAVKPQAQKISIYEDNMHATQHHQFV